MFFLIWSWCVSPYYQSHLSWSHQILRVIKGVLQILRDEDGVYRVKIVNKKNSNEQFLPIQETGKDLMHPKHYVLLCPCTISWHEMAFWIWCLFQIRSKCSFEHFLYGLNPKNPIYGYLFYFFENCFVVKTLYTSPFVCGDTRGYIVLEVVNPFSRNTKFNNQHVRKHG